MQHRTANYRIIAYWRGSRPFLVCVGRSPDECEWMLPESTEHLHFGWAEWMDGAYLQEWIPSSQWRGTWYTLYSVWEKMRSSMRANDLVELGMRESA